jgi:hypothetical protein
MASEKIVVTVPPISVEQLTQLVKKLIELLQMFMKAPPPPPPPSK